MSYDKKRTDIGVKRLKDGDITVTIRLIGFPPSVISAMAADITQRTRSATARTIGTMLSNAVIRAFIKKEDE